MKVVPPITLASTGTFTRSTTATYFDAAGLLQTAAINTPRFGHDPATRVPLGLMAEGAATNFLPNADTPNVWPTSVNGTAAGTVQVVSDARFGNVVRLTKTAGAVGDRFGIVRSVVGLSGRSYCAHIWAKVNVAGTTGNPSYVDANKIGGGLATVVSSLGGEVDVWRKYTTTASAAPVDLQGSAAFYIFVLGPIGSSVDIVFPQLELGAVATSYIPNTTTAAVTRAAETLSEAYGNIPEPDTGEVVWSAATAYTLGQLAIRTSTHRVYQRLIAGTTATAPESDPINWFDAGPTRRTAMLDLYRNTQSSQTAGIQYAVSPGQLVDALALMGLECDQATVAVWANGAQVYSHTELMNTRTVMNWYDYFFAPFTRKENLVLFDLPPYSNGVVSVVLSGTGSVKCGALCLGQATNLGRVEYSAERGSVNFSKVDRDAFGNATLVPRRDVPTTRQTTWLPKALVNRTVAVLTALAGAPAVWSGLEDENADGYFDALLILGVRKEFTVNLAYPVDAKLTLNLEEI